MAKAKKIIGKRRGTARRRGQKNTKGSDAPRQGLLREQTAGHTVEEEGGTAGQQQVERKLEAGRGGGPALSGGDLDAAFEEGDAGEETVGGSSPTPDQDSVDALGEAVGIVAEEEGKTKDLFEIFETSLPTREEEASLEPEEQDDVIGENSGEQRKP